MSLLFQIKSDEFTKSIMKEQVTWTSKSCAQDPDPDPLDPQNFGFLDPFPQKMRIHGSGTKG